MEAARQTYARQQRHAAREGLILGHLPLVRHILARIVATLPETVDRENLEAAGVCGLVEAAGQFDETRGVSFSTYAYPRVRGAILDEMRRNCPLPQQMLERWQRIRAARLPAEQPATPEQIAQATGLTPDEVEDCLRAMQLTRPGAWHAEFSEQLQERSESAPGRALEEAEEVELLAAAIAQLPEQQRVVITLYYRNGLHLKEIGDVLGLSESRISRILSRAELAVREAVRVRSNS